jgi:hypothetical protein
MLKLLLMLIPGNVVAPKVVGMSAATSDLIAGAPVAPVGLAHTRF